MTASAVCPKCGGSVSAAAPEGLCPRCLLRSVIRKPPSVRPAKCPPPLPGAHISVGEYELLQEVGRGGMGVVYRARQSKLNRFVALKLMLLGQLAGDRAKQRVRNEAQAAARLQHPNIVAVYDVGEYEGAPFIAMEYVEGATLDSVAHARPLKPTDAADLVKAIALAIHYAHQQGVVHRDLKPSNIIIDTSSRPRITDFGLAKHLESDATLTLSGQAIGTPSFMSPEQAGGKRRQIGPPTDIYSLGGILYFLLSGRPPFVADTRDEVISQVLRADPVPPRRLNASTPRDLQTICLKCLDKNPNRRYRTAEELADDLGRYLRKEPIRARPANVATKIWRWCQRQPMAASLLAGLLLVSGLAVLLLLFAFIMVVMQLQQAERNATQQQRLREIAEQAVGNLDRATASKLQTAGPFTFTIPTGFEPFTGTKLTTLKRALESNQTVSETESNLAKLDQYFRGNGGPELDLPVQETSLYAPKDRSCAIAYTSFKAPAPTTYPGVEKLCREQLQWLMQHSYANPRSTVESGLTIAGYPAVKIDLIPASGSETCRTYILFLQGDSAHLHTFTIVRTSGTPDEKLIQEFLRSIKVAAPQ